MGRPSAPHLPVTRDPGSASVASRVHFVAPDPSTCVPGSRKPILSRPRTKTRQEFGIPDQPPELTIDDAAAMLKVARAYIITRIEDGTLPYRKVANQRMLPYGAVEAHGRQVLEPRRAAMEEIYALDREFGDVFDPPPPKSYFRS